MPVIRRGIILALFVLVLVYALLHSSFSSNSASSKLSPSTLKNQNAQFRTSKPQLPRINPPLKSIPKHPPAPPAKGAASRPLSRPPSDPVYVPSFVPSSRLPCSVPGYNVFTNLYLSKGRLIFAPSSEDETTFQRFHPAQVVDMAGAMQVIEPISVDDWWYNTMGGDDTHMVEILKGDTIVFHDEPGPAGYLAFHDNFATEVYLGALKILSTASLSSTQSSPSLSTQDTDLTDIRRIVFPQCGDGPFPLGWKDEGLLNEKLIKHTLPDVEILHASDWTGRSKLLERVVIVDRRAAHSHPYTGRWAKMNAHIAVQPSPLQDWFAPYRSTAIETYGLQIQPISKPVVVYIDRTRHVELPRVAAPSHTALIKALRTIADIAEVHVTVMSRMTLPETIELLSRATIIISASTPDLRAMMWMPAVEGSTVIEMMDSDSFIRDHELLCEMIGHSHILIRNHEVLPKDTWLNMAQIRSPNYYGEYEVDPAVVVESVRTILGFPGPTMVD